MSYGFKLFETRKIEDAIDVEFFEKKYGLDLPPFYKLFITTFYPEIVIDTYLDPIANEYLKCFAYEYCSDKTIFLGSIGTLEETLKFWATNFDEEYYPKDEMLPFASSYGNEMVYVGLKGNKKDKIFATRNDAEKYFYVCENIFDFIRNLRLIELNGLYNNHQYNQLYKNWGEDFWRVREDEKL